MECTQFVHTNTAESCTGSLYHISVHSVVLHIRLEAGHWSMRYIWCTEAIDGLVYMIWCINVSGGTCYWFTEVQCGDDWPFTYVNVMSEAHT